MMSDLLRYELAQGLVENRRIRTLSSGGRRSLGCWEVQDLEGKKRIIKISRLDQDVLAINQRLISRTIVHSSRYYSIPAIEQIRIDASTILASYEYVPHQSFKWEDLRSLSQGKKLALAVADFNTRNNGEEALAYLPQKRFRFALTQSRLQQIFPHESKDFCQRTTDKARQLYATLLAKVSEYNCFENMGLAHNDLAPLNIGTTHHLMNGSEQLGIKRREDGAARGEESETQGISENKLLLLDLDNAVVAPLGTDLRFILFAVSRRTNRLEHLNRIAKSYHSLVTRRNLDTSLLAIKACAILGYADAWLNLHRRARSVYDRARLDRCLELCQSVLEQNILT